MDPAQIIMMVVIFVPSLVLHEFSHAIAATALGDPTPRWEGRLTLNPVVHFDPFGFLMVLLTFTTGFGIGWARPVGINPQHFKNPARDTMLVALAGPGSNLALALIFGLTLRVLLATGTGLSVGLLQFLTGGTVVNLGLALFNSIPLPPLDGSRVLRFFLRGSLFNFYHAIEPYGMVILFALVFVFRGFLDILVFTPRNFLFYLITGV